MKTACLLAVAILLIGGCGRTPEPTPVVVPTQPLRIEARYQGGAWALFVNDEKEPVTDEVLLKRIQEHAEVVDPAAGFAGRDSTGQSQNRVIFSAPPEAPREFFCRVAMFVVVLFVKVDLELLRSGLAPLRCDVELPCDESLGPPRDHWLQIEIVDGEEASFQAGMMGRTKLPVPDAALAAAAWDDVSFRKRRSALVRTALQTAKELDYHDAHVQWKPSEMQAPWGPVFQALDAIAELNAMRRQRGNSSSTPGPSLRPDRPGPWWSRQANGPSRPKSRPRRQSSGLRQMLIEHTKGAVPLLQGRLSPCFCSVCGGRNSASPATNYQRDGRRSIIGD